MNELNIIYHTWVYKKFNYSYDIVLETKIDIGIYHNLFEVASKGIFTL